MAIYIEKPSRTVEAIQWDASAKDAVSVKGVTILPYTLAKGEKDTECNVCGQLMSAHGMRSVAGGFDTICPGKFVYVDDDGVIRYRTEAQFLARYGEGVKA